MRRRVAAPGAAAAAEGDEDEEGDEDGASDADGCGDDVADEGPLAVVGAPRAGPGGGGRGR